MYNSIKTEEKIIEDELKSLLNTSDNASRLLAQRLTHLRVQKYNISCNLPKNYQ